MISESIKKFSSVDHVNIYLFSTLNTFLTDFALWKRPHCLYRDSLASIKQKTFSVNLVLLKKTA